MMKKVLIATLALLALFMVVPQGLACFYFRPPIVSTDLLERNLNGGNLVVLDVRGEDAYNADHIPGAINVPEAEWYVNDPFTVPINISWMEMPEDDELFTLIGNAGITRYSWVVVVGATTSPLGPLFALYNTAGITRVAMALLYAGVRYVSVLDGGYDKWVVEGKPVSTVAVEPISVTYEGPVDETMLVTAGYVEDQIEIGESIIVDARDEIVYNGTIMEPWALDEGHIPTARNLPTPTLWNVELDGEGNVVYITYKDVWTLWSMVLSVVGTGGCFKEIIVYCGVGGYASTVYFVLSEVLWYRNVRVYDGSAQDWYILEKEFVT